jgi:Transmembrane secretion effector
MVTADRGGSGLGVRQHGSVLDVLWRRIPGGGGWSSGFNRLSVAQALAGAGDALVTVSLAGSLFFNLSPEASKQQVLLYLVINMAPFVALAPLIGPAIDRFPGGHRGIAATLFTVRAGLAVALAFVLFELGFYFVALALLVAGKASGVTRQALVPGLVDSPERLVAANARLSRTTAIAAAVGAGLGVPLMASTSPTVTLVVACGCLVGAAATAGTLPAVVTAPAVTTAVEYEEVHTPTIVATAWAFGVVRAVVGYFVFGLAFALRRESEPAWMYGAAVAAYGAGTFAGSVVAPLLRRRYGEDRLVAGSLVGVAVVAAFGALGPSRLLVLTVAIVLGMAAMIGRQGFDAMVQRRAPTAVRGRTFARFEAGFQLAWVAGAIAATAGGVSTRISLAVIAVALIPVAALYARSIGAARAAHAEDPFDDVDVARRRLDFVVEWKRRGRPRLAVTELAALIDLARAGDRLVSAELINRIDRLRSVAVAGADPDETELALALDQTRQLLAELDVRRQDDASTAAVDEAVTVHCDERRASVSTQRDQSSTDQ